MQDQQSDIHVNLWPAGCWTEDDVDDLLAAIVEFGSVTGSRTHELRGLGLQVLLSFTAGTIAGGFLSALGIDAYQALKVRIKRVFSRPAERLKESNDLGDMLGFIVREGALDLHLYGSFENDAQLLAFMGEAGAVFRAIWNAALQGRPPCVRGMNHLLRAHWHGGPVPEWDISVHVLDDDGNSMVGKDAFIAAGSLTEEAWREIAWMSTEEGRRIRAARNDSELARSTSRPSSSA